MKIIKRVLRSLFRILPKGTVVQLRDDVGMFGVRAGTTMTVTGYCKYFHRLGYRLDGHSGEIYLREDFDATWSSRERFWEQWLLLE